MQHHDIGQMNLYLDYFDYFATEENVEGDNPPIGIILTRHKDELLVEYAIYQMNGQFHKPPIVHFSRMKPTISATIR